MRSDDRNERLAVRFYKSKEKLRQMRRSEEVAIDCYLGKSALLQTYEELGIFNNYVHQLAKTVRLKKQMLDNRGSDV